MAATGRDYHHRISFGTTLGFIAQILSSTSGSGENALPISNGVMRNMRSEVIDHLSLKLGGETTTCPTKIFTISLVVAE